MPHGEDGMVGVEEGMENIDTSGNVTGSDFDEDGEEAGAMFPGELLGSDPEKDEAQDPPSSTTGDQHDKPGKRANQGQCHHPVSPHPQEQTCKRCLTVFVDDAQYLETVPILSAFSLHIEKKEPSIVRH